MAKGDTGMRGIDTLALNAERQDQLHEMLIKEPMSAMQVAEVTGWPIKSIRRLIHQLLDDGLITEAKAKRGPIRMVSEYTGVPYGKIVRHAKVEIRRDYLVQALFGMRNVSALGMTA